MSDLAKRRERDYWIISWILFFASTFCLLNFFQGPLIYENNPLIFLAIGAISIPFSLFVDFMLTAFSGFKNIKVFVKDPTVNRNRQAEMNCNDFLNALYERLEEVGFVFDINDSFVKENYFEVKFSKPKDSYVQAFINHAFAGKIGVHGKDLALKINGCVTMQDFILVDTGESERLLSLCDYLILKSSELRYHEIPHLLEHGLSISYMSIIFCLYGLYSPGFNQSWSAYASVWAIVFFIISKWSLAKDKKKYIGLRLLVMGVILALVPIINIVLQMNWDFFNK